MFQPETELNVAELQILLILAHGKHLILRNGERKKRNILSYFINRLAFETCFFLANLRNINLRSNVSSVTQVLLKVSLVDSKMNLYFTYESRGILKSFASFITVKTITKLSLEHRRRGSRSPDNAEFGHFTLLFCRERQRNVSRIITHVYGGRELPLIFLMVFYFKVTISIRNKLIWNAKKMLI